MADAVVDASALVDVLQGDELGAAVRRRISGHALHAPAHVDAEVLSALGRLQRAGTVEAGDVASMLDQMAAAPVQRHSLAGLLAGAWGGRHQLRLADAVYVELATSLGLPLVTTARRLRPAPAVEVVLA